MASGPLCADTERVEAEPSHVLVERLQQSLQREREAIEAAFKERGYTGHFVADYAACWHLDLLPGHCDRRELHTVNGRTCDEVLAAITALPLAGQALVDHCDALRRRSDDLERDHEALLATLAMAGIAVSFNKEPNPAVVVTVRTQSFITQGY